jgi:hypothetical protein
MQAVLDAPIQVSKALRPRRVPEPGDAMDPTQTKLFLIMTLVSLLFAAQLATQTGAFAALP